MYLTPKEGFSCKIRCIYYQMEDFHVRYDVCSTKKRKNHAYEWLKRGEKRKENEKKDYPD